MPNPAPALTGLPAYPGVPTSAPPATAAGSTPAFSQVLQTVAGSGSGQALPPAAAADGSLATASENPRAKTGAARNPAMPGSANLNPKASGGGEGTAVAGSSGPHAIQVLTPPGPGIPQGDGPSEPEAPGSDPAGPVAPQLQPAAVPGSAGQAGHPPGPVPATPGNKDAKPDKVRVERAGPHGDGASSAMPGAEQAAVPPAATVPAAVTTPAQQLPAVLTTAPFAQGAAGAAGSPVSSRALPRAHAAAGEHPTASVTVSVGTAPEVSSDLSATFAAPSPGLPPLAKMDGDAQLTAGSALATETMAAGVAGSPSAPVNSHPAPAPATAVPPASAPPPVAQIAPVLVHIARTDDVQRLTVRLEPAELGPIEVRVERAANGPAKVELFTARADTLDLLRSDGAALNRALDSAGVPADGRQLSFNLGSSHGDGSSFSGGSGFRFGESGSSPGGGQQPHPHFFTAAAAAPGAGWQRAGVDLLA